MGAAASTECGIINQSTDIRASIIQGKPLDASDIQVSSFLYNHYVHLFFRRISN
jgi:hypothetical protein